MRPSLFWPFRARTASMADLRYISTRGKAPVLGFEEVLLAGLARDGGLYLPERWPALGTGDLRMLRGLGYATLAAHLLRPFVGRAAEKYLVAGKSWGDKGPKRVVTEIVESLDRDSILREARDEILARLRRGAARA